MRLLHPRSLRVRLTYVDGTVTTLYLYPVKPTWWLSKAQRQAMIADIRDVTDELANPNTKYSNILSFIDSMRPAGAITLSGVTSVNIE